MNELMHRDETSPAVTHEVRALIEQQPRWPLGATLLVVAGLGAIATWLLPVLY